MSLTKGKLRRDTSLNVVGQLVPVVVALGTVPAYLHLIGSVRYGALMILWTMLGYFGVLDLGLGRATANLMARVDRDPSARGEVFWTAMTLNLAAGSCGSIILLLSGSWIAGNMLHISMSLRDQMLVGLPFVAAAVPLVTGSAVCVGSLQGQERFLELNVAEALGTALLQIVPLAMAYIAGPGLAGLVEATIAARAAGAAVLLALSLRSLESRSPRFAPHRVRSMLHYGGWVAVTSLVGPLLTTLDRIVIGAQVGVVAVAYYTIPYNLVSRSQMLPSGLVRALFPRLSGQGRHDVLAERSLRVMIAIATPITIASLVMLRPALSIWLGANVGAETAPIGEVLLLGMWVNSLAFLPFAVLQAEGRPDIVAKFHVVELPLYLLMLWGGLVVGGLIGAAWAWTLRVSIDAALLFYASRHLNWSFTPVFCSASLLVATLWLAATLFAQLSYRVVVGVVLIIIAVSISSLLARSEPRRLPSVAPKLPPLPRWARRARKSPPNANRKVV